MTKIVNVVYPLSDFDYKMEVDMTVQPQVAKHVKAAAQGEVHQVEMQKPTSIKVGSYEPA
jgi:hypothetical protein